MDITFEIIFVEGCKFTMGCTNEQDKYCNDNEKPEHQETLSDYYIANYKVIGNSCATPNRSANAKKS